MGLAPALQADPPKGLLVSASCSNGQAIQVNIGVPTNGSSQFFVTTDTSIFVIKRVVATDQQGQVVFSKDYGVQGFSSSQLTTS
jgi:hypothetical protein